jgi:hypothetical protein
MKVVVLTCEEDEVLLRLAREIAEGAREAGEEPIAVKSVGEASVAEAELVFFGFTAHRRFFWNYASECAMRALKAPENEGVWKGKRLAFFAACYGEAARGAMQDVVRAAGEAGGRVVNTLAIVAQKTRQGDWNAGEIDLARARGFGERTTNNAKGAVVFRSSEKHRIKKYLK